MRFLRSRWILVLLGIMAVALFWHFWGADWWAERKWQKYAREARASGMPWTLVELRPPAVPIEEDLSRLSIFSDPKAGEKLRKHTPTMLTKIPPLGERRPRVIDWKRTRGVLLSDYQLPVDANESSDLAAIDAALQPLQPFVDELCRSKAVAANWGDTMWKYSPLFDPPESAIGRCAVRILEIRSALDLVLNRPGPAREAIEAQLRLTQAFAKTPTLLQWAMNSQGFQSAAHTVWRGVIDRVWDDESLRRFAQLFASQNVIRDIQWSLRTERAFIRENAESMLNNPSEIAKFIALAYSPGWDLQEWMLRLRVGRRSWWRENQLWFENAFEEILAQVDPESGIYRPRPRNFDAGKLSSLDSEVTLFMAAELSHSMEGFLRSGIYLQAQNYMLSIACGLELYRRATGKYPAVLDELVPRYLPRVPLDPATGGAFRYRLEENGKYFLYSHGINQTDDGGNSANPRYPEKSDPDWIWWTPL